LTIDQVFKDFRQAFDPAFIPLVTPLVNNFFFDYPYELIAIQSSGRYIRSTVCAVQKIIISNNTDEFNKNKSVI